MNNRKVLIVDDDEVLGRVLGRVLSQQGYSVTQASTVAEALQVAQEQTPALALLDLSLPDGNGTDLGERLRARYPDQMQILMTGYPLRLREHPELAAGFARVFTKPLDLKELRQTVDNLFHGKAATNGSPKAESSSAIPEVVPVPAAEVVPSRTGMPSWLKTGVILVLLAIVVIGAALALPLVGLPSVRELLEPKAQVNTEETKRPADEARLDPQNPNALILPKDVVHDLNVQAVPAQKASETRPLHLDGYLAYDVNNTVTINTLFTGQVESLPKYPDPVASRFAGRTEERPVQYKDIVKEGQVLAVIYSKDLGEKKSELVGAWSQYNLDRQNLKIMEQLDAKGLTAPANVLQARQAVEIDLNNVDKAIRTLAVWKVTETEITALKEEAERLLALNQSDRAQQKITERAGAWAKVEVRAPFDGVIVERNIAPGLIVDPSKDLYKVARLDHMTVYAHAYEDMLPALLSLPPEDRRWKIQLSANPNFELPEGRITTIGSIDPNQHTGLLIGSVPNPKDPRTEERPLVAGQFITATVQLPPPAHEVAIPTTALIDGGKESLVLIQPNAAEPRYEVRHVQVARRTQDTVYLRWLGGEDLTTSAGPALATAVRANEVQPGERVVTNGTLLILAKLQDLQSKKGE